MVTVEKHETNFVPARNMLKAANLEDFSRMMVRVVGLAAFGGGCAPVSWVLPRVEFPLIRGGSITTPKTLSAVIVPPRDQTDSPSPFMVRLFPEDTPLEVIADIYHRLRHMDLRSWKDCMTYVMKTLPPRIRDAKRAAVVDAGLKLGAVEEEARETRIERCLLALRETQYPFWIEVAPMSLFPYDFDAYEMKGCAFDPNRFCEGSIVDAVNALKIKQ